jgi:hypothetical protein
VALGPEHARLVRLGALGPSLPLGDRSDQSRSFVLRSDLRWETARTRLVLRSDQSSHARQLARSS